MNRDDLQRELDERYAPGSPMQQALGAMDDLQTLRDIARQISELSFELVRRADSAHKAGRSWQQIATAMRGHWRSGMPDALGRMLPGGTSATTTRKYVLARTGAGR